MNAGLHKLPPGWCWASLPQLGELNRGKSKHRPRNDPKLYGGKYPFIQTGDVCKSNGFIREYEQTYSEVGLKQSRLWPAGTLCITIAANIAETGLLAFEACFPDSIVGFRNEIHPTLVQYLEYFIRTAQSNLERYAPATAQKNINLQTLSELKVPLAPEREQHRIVQSIETNLTKLDAAVTALKRVKANLKRYRASVLKTAVEGQLVPTEAELARKEGRDYEPASKLLERILKERRHRWEEAELAKMKAKGKVPKDDKWKAKYKGPKAPDTANLPELPEGWCWASVDQTGIVSGGLTKNSKRDVLPLRLPYLRVANVYADELRLDSVTEIGVKEQEVPGYSLNKGDLLVVEGNGSIEQVGRVAVWDGSISPCLHQNHLIKVRFAPVELGAWVLAWMLSPGGRVHVERVASSTSGLHTLSISKVGSLPVPLCPVAEQARIVSEVERVFSHHEQLLLVVEQSLRKSERTRQAILKWAFEGKLVDQDPADEPASAILDQIQAEKASAEPPKKKRGGGRKKKTARKNP